MEFKSEAHRRKYLELVKRGKLSKEQFDARDSATKKAQALGLQLPERVSKKKKRK